MSQSLLRLEIGKVGNLKLERTVLQQRSVLSRNSLRVKTKIVRDAASSLVARHSSKEHAEDRGPSNRTVRTVENFEEFEKINFNSHIRTYPRYKGVSFICKARVYSEVRFYDFIVKFFQIHLLLQGSCWLQHKGATISIEAS